jgi:hypothetical protein
MTTTVSLWRCSFMSSDTWAVSFLQQFSHGVRVMVELHLVPRVLEGDDLGFVALGLELPCARAMEVSTNKKV